MVLTTSAGNLTSRCRMQAISPELLLQRARSKSLCFTLTSAALTQRSLYDFRGTLRTRSHRSRRDRIARFHKATILDHPRPTEHPRKARAGNHAAACCSGLSLLRSHAETTQHLAAKKISARTSRKASLICILVTPLAIDLHHFRMSLREQGSYHKGHIGAAELHYAWRFFRCAQPLCFVVSQRMVQSIFFRFEVLKWVLFSVLLSNPFARRFSAVPRSFVIWSYAVTLLFTPLLEGGPVKRILANRILPHRLCLFADMDSCLLALFFSDVCCRKRCGLQGDGLEL